MHGSSHNVVLLATEPNDLPRAYNQLMDPEAVGTDAEKATHADEAADVQKAADAEKAWNQWCRERNEALASEHGWLSLTSLTWIPSADGPVEGFPGTWRAVDGEKVYATFSSDDDVTRNGAPVEGEVVFQLDDGGSEISLRHGTKAAEVAKRGGRYAVRVRDSLAPTRQIFKGVPVYGYDPTAVAKGTFEPFDKPRDIPITTANPAVPGVARIVGVVEFVYAGASAKLVVQGDSSTLTAVFYDGTNGVETADWRYVSFDAPEGGGAGPVEIDFNRAANFPAAFTPFGTCPMPPVGNGVQAPIRAGERRPFAEQSPANAERPTY